MSATPVRFPSREPVVFGAAEEIEWQASPSLCRHQVDIGLSTAGSGVLSVDYGVGYRYQVAVTFTDTQTGRLPIILEGDIRKFKFTPTDASAGGYSVSYSATFIGSR